MPQLFSNNARALLVSGISATDTSLTVEAAKADLFPTANTGTGSVPAATNWFKLTLQNAAGDVEIVYVRSRNVGSGVMSNVLRGREGTTARMFAAGTVVGLRITALDVQQAINFLASANTFAGDNLFLGTNTFEGPLVALQTIVGSISGNAATVTNGVYTSGNQVIGGSKTFSQPIVGSLAGSAETAGVAGQAYKLSSVDWTFEQQGTDLVASYGGVRRFKVDSSGNATFVGNVTAYGTV